MPHQHNEGIMRLGVKSLMKVEKAIALYLQNNPILQLLANTISSSNAIKCIFLELVM